MKRAFIIFILFFLTMGTISATDTVTNDPRNFSLHDLNFNRITLSFTVTQIATYFSKPFFLKLGFTEDEAHDYSIFAGIVFSLAFELATNLNNNGFKRENSLIGLGVSLIVIRF